MIFIFRFFGHWFFRGRRSSFSSLFSLQNKMASSSKNKNIPRVLDFEDDDSGVGGTSGGDSSEEAGNGRDASTSTIVDDSSFYGILNVAVDASEDDLKRSFRLLAAACHPDKVRDPELRPAAADAFAKVQQAYEVRRLIERLTDG